MALHFADHSAYSIHLKRIPHLAGLSGRIFTALALPFVLIMLMVAPDRFSSIED